ncbi:hypothetical protein RFEPED_0024 [Rickettsia felis str. Pedreira]|uniref:Uncharacterized protein n=1 Tax=Rickettsia felis str. Pedreira TaxID=1359196 RepID=A0A0F3MPH2_RICFI|nr:hypothetical protein RFEPED_0024 [Rickettsia felis str. Pedreira]
MIKYSYIFLINNKADRRSLIWKRAKHFEAYNRSVYIIREDYKREVTPPIFQIKRV